MAAPVILAGRFDPEQAFGLSAEAGWNQTAGDWVRLCHLAPHGCFSISESGQLISTAIGLPYDDSLGWIGMVITHPAHRGKGYASALLRRAIEYLDEAGVRCMKLDATNLGRPVYLKLGFEDEQPVSRWLRRPAAAAAVPPLASNLDNTAFKLDREAVGADRSALLRELSKHEVYCLPSGFALARPGRLALHFGPCLARDAVTAEALLRAFLVNHPSVPAIFDLSDGNSEAVELARSQGFEPVRHLMRMARGTSPPARGSLVYAHAGFEYG